MDGFWVGIGSALWLGILTSISPCPLATNVAAVSFLSRKVNHPKWVFLSGLSYTIGRMISYAVLGFIIVQSFLSVPIVANTLQKTMNKAFGPILILTGLFLLDIFSFNIRSFSISSERQEKLANSGFIGSFVLGLLFALVFCPVSAALFFGSLIPLSLKNSSAIILPSMYGVGTALPVLLFALLIALGVTSLSYWFTKLTQAEKMMRKMTGIIFILVGLYYISIYFKII
ncbi:MAG: aromatic aminobenezylarsenical efflux permease ArsG family transporter [Elusimicrobia bacterium]|nr:aromatic aminobenezylarsenical efflux permease ArsG family transporter [Candidatus Obscuribacterium magneticum]